MIPIKADNVLLSAWQQSDVDALAGLINNQHIYANTLLIPHPYSLEDAKSFIARCREYFLETGMHLDFSIKDKAGQLLGGIGFMKQELSYLRHSVEIGYWVGEPYWGSGIATKALKAMVGWIFSNLPIKRITAHVYEENTASMRVLEKAGFAYEGLLKKYYIKDDKHLNARLYALVQ